MEIKLFVSFIQPRVHLNGGSFDYKENVKSEWLCRLRQFEHLFVLRLCLSPPETHHGGQAHLKLVILQRMNIGTRSSVKSWN